MGLYFYNRKSNICEKIRMGYNLSPKSCDDKGFEKRRDTTSSLWEQLNLKTVLKLYIEYREVKKKKNGKKMRRDREKEKRKR